ncbi:hypothetical protein E3N88_22865 [Mikania micrantha]|uniref:Uncharacterized protein n=1 Tax=Mikania micrantha TaxID=192012 RepID=A0A5N6NBW5_9ASTR|nr:hypothetical protein E3N88_22865 [Mikania micrantha]
MKLNQQTLTQGNDEILHHGTPRAPKSESRPSNPRNRFRDSRSNEEIEETQSKSEERTKIPGVARAKGRWSNKPQYHSKV